MKKLTIALAAIILASFALNSSPAGATSLARSVGSEATMSRLARLLGVSLTGSTMRIDTSAVYDPNCSRVPGMNLIRQNVYRTLAHISSSDSDTAFGITIPFIESNGYIQYFTAYPVVDPDFQRFEIQDLMWPSRTGVA